MVADDVRERLMRRALRRLAEAMPFSPEWDAAQAEVEDLRAGSGSGRKAAGVTAGKDEPANGRTDR